MKETREAILALKMMHILDTSTNRRTYATFIDRIEIIITLEPETMLYYIILEKFDLIENRIHIITSKKQKWRE